MQNLESRSGYSGEMILAMTSADPVDQADMAGIVDVWGAERGIISTSCQTLDQVKQELHHVNHEVELRTNQDQRPLRASVITDNLQIAAEVSRIPHVQIQLVNIFRPDFLRPHDKVHDNTFTIEDLFESFNTPEEHRQ